VSEELHFTPLRAVIDTCVFPRSERWVKPLLSLAEAGYVQPLWSPAIIAETGRLLTWLWVKRNGWELSDARWHDLSEVSHRWFAYLTPYFRVVEDWPPAATLWMTPPPDEWDVPLWTAATVGHARFVVTENLRDGPPPNSEGVRLYQGVVYTHPDRFLRFATWFSHTISLLTLPRYNYEPLTFPPVPTLADSELVPEDQALSSLQPLAQAFINSLFPDETPLLSSG
jgi:hypothetical protein